MSKPENPTYEEILPDPILAQRFANCAGKNPDDHILTEDLKVCEMTLENDPKYFVDQGIKSLSGLDIIDAIKNDLPYLYENRKRYARNPWMDFYGYRIYRTGEP